MSYSVSHVYRAIDKEMAGKKPLTISVKPEFLYLILTILSDALIALPLLPRTKVDMASWMEEANEKLKTASPTAAKLIKDRLSKLYKNS